jgi:hypothetical protein
MKRLDRESLDCYAKLMWQWVWFEQYSYDFARERLAKYGLSAAQLDSIERHMDKNRDEWSRRRARLEAA